MKKDVYTIRYLNIHQEAKEFETDAYNILEAIGDFLNSTRHSLTSICSIEC